MNFIRTLARKCIYTQNTIRYRVEWRKLKQAWRHIPTQVHTLVDGGAGSGEYARRLLKEGFCQKVHAIEYDKSNFKCLRDNLGRNPQAELIHGSILDIPLKDEIADAVMSTQVLEHIEDHQQAAGELNRILKPGGYGVISVPHPPEPFPNEGHVREGYTAQDLATLFSNYGWQAVWTDYFLTRSTVNRMQKADASLLSGKWIPLSWIDAEQDLEPSAIKADLPFGIVTVFKKPS